MAIVNRNDRKPVIDLAGPGGNAFALLGSVREYGKQLGWDMEKIKAVQAEMTSGDYKNLVSVFDREFGSYIDLILPENPL
jgi:hypothetical protein